MTTFDLLESGLESSEPIELFEFTLGTNVFRYTSSEDEITIGPNTFTPLAIARKNIIQGADANTRVVNITMPSNSALAMLYVSTVPGDRAFVSIFRYQRQEVPAFNTQVLLFQGLVQSVRFVNDAQSAEFAVRSLENALNQQIPRFTYMGMCNHFLYDVRCGINPALHNHIGTVTLVSGNDITVAGLAASGLDVVSGYCQPTGELDFRTVYAQSGDTITTLLPFASDPTGASLQVFAGCDHLVLGDCALTYDNVAKFGGFPFVPKRNIFETGIDPA